MEIVNALKVDLDTLESDFRQLVEGMTAEKERWSDLKDQIESFRDLDIREVTDGLGVASRLPKQEIIDVITEKKLGQLRKAHYDEMQKAS